jgi:hypothetical protein
MLLKSRSGPVDGHNTTLRFKYGVPLRPSEVDSVKNDDNASETNTCRVMLRFDSIFAYR